jgi:hypothetical protein
MALAVDTAHYVQAGIAAVFLLLVVLAFVRYTRRGGRGAGDAHRRAAERAGADAKVCPGCAADAAREAPVCSHCGYEFA